MKRSLLWYGRWLALAFVLAGLVVVLRPAQAGFITTTVVVGPANVLSYPGGPGSWYTYITRGNGNTAPETSTGRYNFVYGPGTPPAGTGSLRLATGSGVGGSGVTGNGGRVFVVNRDLDGVLLSSISSFSYSTYISARNTSTVVAPGINLYVDLNGNGTYSNAEDALLIYEPAYTTSQATAEGVWQTWNVLAPDALWWDVRGNGAGSGPPTGARTLSQIATLFPNARVFPFGGGAGLFFVVGSSGGTPFDNFVGNIDNISLGTPTITNQYNFEPASTIYIDPNWSAVPELVDVNPSGAPEWAVSTRFNTGTFVSTPGCPTSPTSFLQDGFVSRTQAETVLGASPLPGTVIECIPGYSSNPVPGTTINAGSALVGSPATAISLVVNSTGGAPLTITGVGISGANDTDFAVTPGVPPTISLNGTSVPPAGSQTFNITCTPSALGTRIAVLSVTHNATNVASPATYPLTCEGLGQPGYGSSPVPGSIGLNTNAGTTTGQTITISETGNAALEVSNIGETGDAEITVDIPTLPFTIADGGSTREFDVQCFSFTPGTFTKTVTVTHNAPGSPAVYNVTCNVTAPGYGSNPAPGPVTINTVVGSALASTVTVNETGNQDLVISNIVAAGDSAISLSSVTLPITIVDGGATQNFGIICFSNAVGVYTGTVTVTHNAPGSPAVYNVTCNVTAAPQPAYNSTPLPGPVIISSAVVGTPETRTITMSENGTANLVISAIAPVVGGAPEITLSSLPTLPVTIADGSGTTVPFGITCSSATPGTFSSTIEVTHNAPGSPAQYAVTCNVAAAATPGYGSVPAPGSAITISAPVGGSASSTVVVSETGSANLVISDDEITGSLALTATSTAALPTTIANGSGATVTYTITCAPTSLTPITGTLTITHNAPGSPATYPITCTPSGNAFSPSIPPGPITVPPGGTQSVTISNTSPTDTLTLTSIGYSGSPQITLTSFPNGTTIAPGGAAQTFSLTCTVAGAGPYSGTVTIVYQTSASPTPVTVTYNVTCAPTVPPTAFVPPAPPPCPQAAIPAGSVVGRLSATAQIYYAPGQQSPGLSLPGGTAYWVLGLDSTGEYYQIILSCQRLWVEADLMGPNFEPPWFGAPLPTGTVQ